VARHPLGNGTTPLPHSPAGTFTRYLLLVLVLAVLTRGLYLADSRDNPTFRVPVVDARTYDGLARQIAEQGRITRDLFWQPPFYPLVLSLVYKATGSSIVAAKVIQAAVGVLTSLLVYLLAAGLFGPVVGLFSGVVVSLYLPLVFFEGELLATGWASFWAVLLVYLFVRASGKPGAGGLFFLGLTGALAVITRPVFLPFFAAGCLWLGVSSFIRLEKKRFLRAGTALAAGFLIVALPVALMGRAATGKARILPFSGGVNLYIGNNPNYEETIAIRPGYAWERFMEAPEAHGIRDIYAKEKYFRDQALSFALNRPLAFLEGLAAKTARFFSAREIPRNVSIYSFRKWSWMLRVGVWKAGGFGFPFGLLLALAVLGAVHLGRRLPVPVWFFLLLYPAAVILVFASARYRAPAVPVLALLAGGGCAALLEAARARRWRKLGLLLALAAAVMLAASLPGPFAEEKLDYDAELRYFLGVALENRGHTEEAKAAYLEALRLNPGLADAFYNLGVIAEKEKDPDEALEYYRRAVRADPGHSHACYNLGVLLQARGELEEAAAAYRKALSSHPSDPFAHNNLGSVLRSLGFAEEAAEHYRQAVKFKPDYTAAHNNLGHTLLGLGRWDEAGAHFIDALRLRPGLLPAMIGMARVLAEHPDASRRDPERAVLLAEQASRGAGGEDPRYLEVLASAYAAAGRIDEASETASRALELAESMGRDDLAKRLREKLALYRRRGPD